LMNMLVCYIIHLLSQNIQIMRLKSQMLVKNL